MEKIEILKEQIRKIIKEELENTLKTDIKPENEVNLNIIKPDLNSIIKTFQSDLNNISKENQNQNDLNEAGIMTTAGILLTVPAILGLVSRLGKVVKSKVDDLLGKKPTSQDGMDEYLIKMSKVADDLHHLYLTPIEKTVGLMVKDKTKAHKIANIILHIIIGIFCLSAGITAVKALQTNNISLSLLESALTAIKGGEIKEFITKMIETI